NDIGVNIWPWKKMETGNSPCSVKKPAGWDWITGFARGGDRPSYARAQAIFDEYLDNIRFERCEWRGAVIPSITRSPGCVFKACDHVSIVGAERIGDRWEDALMRFSAGSAASYDLMAEGTCGVLAFSSDFGEGAGIEVAAGDEVLCTSAPSGEEEVRVRIPSTEACRMTIRCTAGAFTLGDLRWEKE
nr:hypothetical protein [Clostridiales bacterium]